MAPTSYTIIQRSLCFRNSTQMVSQFIVSKKVASWASVYTDAPFRQTRPPARFAKPACWGHPQSPYDCQLRCQPERRFNPLVTITYNKKQGKADPESIHFCPALLITTVTILSAAVWQLPALSSGHRRRTAPRSVWASEPVEPNFSIFGFKAGIRN